jgi:hypothetical protein
MIRQEETMAGLSREGVELSSDNVIGVSPILAESLEFIWIVTLGIVVALGLHFIADRLLQRSQE